MTEELDSSELDDCEDLNGQNKVTTKQKQINKLTIKQQEEKREKWKQLADKIYDGDPELIAFRDALEKEAREIAAEAKIELDKIKAAAVRKSTRCKVR